MPQTFEPHVELIVKLVMALVFGGTVLAFAVIVWQNRDGTDVGSALAQPIPFSHKHHVGDVGLDCRFCHVSVETRATPGLPSAQVCLSCHSQLFADQPMFAPLRESAASGRPIAWRQVNRLPDYVYFDHSVHVAKGVACMECHGRLDQMPLVRKTASLQMRWCVACHENPGPHLHPPGEVFAMPSAPVDAAEVESLARLMKIESRRRLTDCSTCHR
jgi:hypothetical protein